MIRSFCESDIKIRHLLEKIWKRNKKKSANKSGINKIIKVIKHYFYDIRLPYDIRLDHVKEGRLSFKLKFLKIGPLFFLFFENSAV